MTLVGPVRVALDAQDELGEGPFWDDLLRELLRVDIGRGKVHSWNPSSDATTSRNFGQAVSAVIPRMRGDGWVLAAGHCIFLAENGGLRRLASVEEDRPSNRFNDAKCDPQGRLWAGTMCERRTPGAGSLYRLTPGEEIEQVLPDTTISNGLGWSPAGDQMYFVDSTTRRLDVFDFEAATGAIAERRTFATIQHANGIPDGLTVDAEGGVWVCLFGGGRAHRYSADGTLDAVLPLPVTNPTSLAFGGPDLRTLYITSARRRLSVRQLATEPMAGAVLAIDVGVTGLAGNRFAG